MTSKPESIALARIPGQYIAQAGSRLKPGTIAGERCTAVITVPAPWNIGTVRITYEWFIPARRGSLSFWSVVSAESADGEEAPAA